MISYTTYSEHKSSLTTPPLNAITRNDLRNAFRSLGVQDGMSVMLHSSLSGIGYLVNGPFDVIDAVFDCIGPEGTLIVPAHTGQLTDPSDWSNPEILNDNIPKVRENMRPFDRRLTLPRNRGIVSQVFLMYPNVERSDHPLNSVAARGAHAKTIVSTHPLHESEGETSPIGKLYDIGGMILLLGVGLESCTGLHLAEFISDTPYLRENKVKVLVDDLDGRRFEKLKRYPATSQYFNKLRSDLVNSGNLTEIRIGNSKGALFNFRTAIDIAVRKLEKNPNYLITK